MRLTEKEEWVMGLLLILSWVLMVAGAHILFGLGGSLVAAGLLMYHYCIMVARK